VAGAGGDEGGGEGGGGDDGCLAGPWLLCLDGPPAREESVASGRRARKRSTRAFLDLVVVAMGVIAS